MKPPETTARSAVDLDATDELPVLDATAYEAELLSREPDGPSDSAAAKSDPSEAGLLAPELRVDNASPPVVDSDVMSAVEHWIVQKTEELRVHHDTLSLVQHERSAAVERADTLNRELAEASTNLEALRGRERALAQALTSEQEAAQRRTTDLEAARCEAALLAQELAEARAAGIQQDAALAASAALLEQRSGELQALQRTHDALIADLQRAKDELSELETRCRDGEARERLAQRAIETQTHSHLELTQRVERETGARERFAAEVRDLQVQLASCLESLHNRESYRTIYESALQELDVELSAVKLRTLEQETRVTQLDIELQARDQRLQDAIRERDEARDLHHAKTTQYATERGDGERIRSALESRLAELTVKHADVCTELLAMEATLTAAEQRAEAAALASGAAAERLGELEAEIASREAELSNEQLEIERNREMLADLTAALVRSQTMLSDQSRLLEEREAAASAVAASHAEQTALNILLRRQIEELTSQLAAPEAERRSLEERVAALTKEVAERDSRLASLESMNGNLRAMAEHLNTSLSEREAELQRATQFASMNAYALVRVQSSIDELGRSLTASEGGSTQAQVSILTRIDNGQNHSVVLRGRTTIGRDRDNDLSLAMRSVSRRHAVLIPAFRTAFVQDLRSTNGVLVNQRRVRCARLEHGDIVSFGEAQFRYTVAAGPTGAMSTASTTSAWTRASLKHAP